MSNSFDECVDKTNVYLFIVCVIMFIIVFNLDKWTVEHRYDVEVVYVDGVKDTVITDHWPHLVNDNYGAWLYSGAREHTPNVIRMKKLRKYYLDDNKNIIDSTIIKL